MTEEQFQTKLAKIQQKNKQKEYRRKLKEEKQKFGFSGKATTSNKVLIAALIAIVWFTITALWIQYETGIEISSTLITLWFSFWTVELVSLAGIKVSKVIKNYDTSNNNTNISGETDINEESKGQND